MKTNVIEAEALDEIHYPPSPRSISILGATGSIGDSTLAIIDDQPEKYRVVSVVGGENLEKLAHIARKTGAELVAIANAEKRSTLKALLSDCKISVLGGEEGVLEAARAPCDMTISSIVGFAGLGPTLAALDGCRYLALANKESLVCAGSLVMAKAAQNGVTVLPLDSEHNAIYQALLGARMQDVENITLTASGGPFLGWDKAAIANAGPADALNHPNWSMGAKITIDSATMMNKGLEVIEAHYLFPVSLEQLDVVVHPQSIMHGMVSFIDGAVLAELGNPDMRTPIAHCMAHPHRISTQVKRLDLSVLGSLTFEAPDMQRFPMLHHAKNALFQGGVATCLLNGANEVVVHHFMKKALSFYQMSDIVEAVIERGMHSFQHINQIDSFELVRDIDRFSRNEALNFIKALT